MIVTGFLSAACIEAGSITTNKLAPEVGQTLNISGNTTITTMQGDIEDAQTAISQITPEYIVQKVSESEIFDQQDWSNGQNLLRDTTEANTMLTYTADSDMVQISGTVELDKKNSASTHLTFRVFIDALESSNDFAACIVPVFPDGNDWRDGDEELGNTIEAETSGWSKVTMEIPSGATHVKVFIKNLTGAAETGLTTYHSPKLEYGQFGTPWNPINSDLVQRVTDAEQKIDYDKITTHVVSTDTFKNQVNTQMTSVVTTVNGMTTTISNHQTAISGLSDTADNLKEWKETWYSMESDGMTIGKRGSGITNPATLFLSNDSIQFRNGDTAVAQITGSQITISNSIFHQTMQIGNLRASIDGNGDNITWSWV